MKKILISFVMALPVLVNAEAFTITFEAACNDTKFIGSALINQFKEVPVLSGKALDEIDSIMTIWANSEEGTWTIVATKDNLSCVIGYGTNLKVITLKEKKKM